MTAPLHIVAAAARTPVGLSAESSAAAVRGAISRQMLHPFMVDMNGKPLRCALDARLDPGLLGTPRIEALARAALREVAKKLVALKAPVTDRPIPALLALPESRPGFTEADAARVTSQLAGAVEGIAFAVQPGGRGHAGALASLQEASRLLSGQGEDLCVVMGADSYLNADTLDWLVSNRQLAGDDARGGFYPGEAAGALVVASDKARRQLRLGALASIRSVATGTEPRTIRGELETLGEGLTKAVVGAASSLRLPEEAVDSVFCDLNGERYRTDEWAFCVLRAQAALKDLDYTAAADCWGDVGAASGALSCLLAAQGFARGYAAGPRTLVWGSSEGGLRAAAVLEARSWA